MKWRNNKSAPYDPRIGDIRKIKRFALFPKSLIGYTIWLEKYEVVQEYEEISICDYELYPYSTLKWVDINEFPIHKVK